MPARLSRVVVLTGAVLAALLCGCVPQTLPDPINVAAGFQAEYLAVGLAEPSAVAAATDGRVFFTEKNTGRIRLIQDGVLQDAPFATVPVNYAGDWGLLGIALPPNFIDSGRVYVFYTRSDTGAATNNPDAVVDHRVVYIPAETATTGGSEVFVAALPVGGTGNVGGQLAFNAEGELFVAFGDSGDSAAAADSARLFGKLLRYTADGAIPTDNPDPNTPVFASGIRQPRGLTVDTETGAVFMIDRIRGSLHELNRVEAGANLGWPTLAGRADTTAEQALAAELTGYVDPLLESTEELVGLGYNPSSKYGIASQLRVCMGNNPQARIIALTMDADQLLVTGRTPLATGLPTPLRDVYFTPAGTLYILTDTAVLRMVEFR
jgi:glucose/arabinose dehydrogenase